MEKLEVEEMDKVPMVEGDPVRNLKVGSKFTKGLRRRLIDFLRSNSDCFALSHEDMPGIDPEIIMHKLQVDTQYDRRGGSSPQKGTRSSMRKSETYMTPGSYEKYSTQNG